MIRLDHDGHEISRDPEPDWGPYAVWLHAEDGHIRYGDKPGGGYWERLAEDMKQAKAHAPGSTYCPNHHVPMMHSGLHGDYLCPKTSCQWATGGYYP